MNYRKYLGFAMIIIFSSFCSCSYCSREKNTGVTFAKDSTFHSKQLSGTIWESADRNQRAKDVEIYTDSTIIIICENYRKNVTDTIIFYYYLSDVIPSEFDFSKVGKKTYGRYLVMYHILPGRNGIMSYRQIDWIGLSEMNQKYTNENVTLQFIRKNPDGE